METNNMFIYVLHEKTLRWATVVAYDFTFEKKPLETDMESPRANLEIDDIHDISRWAAPKYTLVYKRYRLL